MIPSYIQDFVDFAVEKAFQEALRSMQGAPGMGTLHRFSNFEEILYAEVSYKDYR